MRADRLVAGGARMTFDQAFDRLMSFEGGYVNNSADPGGETMWGITSRVARAEGFVGDMKSMPRETACAIARRRYWDSVRCDELPEAIRYAMFDCAYNCGPVQAVKFLQRAVGTNPDGVIGAQTLAAAGNASLAALIALRLDFYTSLPTWGAFGKGWTRRAAAILQGASA